MSRVIKVKCTNILHCGYINTFNESELIGEVPLVDEEGARIPPPSVVVDENTFIKCEQCGYPISCKYAEIING